MNRRIRADGLPKLRSLRDVGILAVTQYGQFLVTLVSVPFMARTLGATGLGHAAAATAAYFLGGVIVDFGLSFPLAARLVGRGDSGSVLRVRYTRLRTMTFAVLVGLAVAVHMAPTPYTIRIAALGLCAGGASALHDSWILMARGQFWRFAFAEWSGRLVYCAVLVAGITELPTPNWVPLSLGAGALTTAATSRLLVRWRTRRHDTDQPSAGTRELVALGLPALLGRLLSTSYSQAAPLFYASLLSAGSVGLFSASDRVIRAAQALSYPAAVAIFPRLSTEQSDIAVLAAKAKRYAVLSAALASVGSVLLVALAPGVVELLYGSGYAPSVNVLRVQSLLLPFAVGSTMLVTNFFNIVGDTRATFLTTTGGLVVTLSSLVIAHASASLYALAFGSVLAEAVVFALSWRRVTATVPTRSARGDQRRDAPDEQRWFSHAVDSELT